MPLYVLVGVGVPSRPDAHIFPSVKEAT